MINDRPIVRMTDFYKSSANRLFKRLVSIKETI